MLFENIKNFFKGGFEEINYVFVQPFLRLSFYKKCFILIMTGLLLYVPYLDAFNANHDEQYTLMMCGFDVWEMIKRIAVEDGHPPFHYLVAKLWVELFGGDVRNVLSLRLMTFSIFIMTALLGVFPIRRLLGEKIALAFICLVFVLPSSFYLITDVRMYSLAVFLLLGEFLYAMLFIYKKEKGDLFLFALFSIFALYTHYYCGILSAIIWIIVLFDLLRMKRYRDLKFFMLSGVFVALLFSPWLWAFYTQYQNMKGMWFPGKEHAFMAINGAFFVYCGFVDIYTKFCLFLGFMSWIFVFEFLADADKKEYKKLIVKRAVITFWGIYLITFILSVFIYPNLVTRYMVIPVGVLYLALSVALVHFKKFRKLFFIAWLAVFVIGYGENYNKVNATTLREMHSYIKNEIPKNSLVLYNYTVEHLALMFFAPEFDIYYVPTRKYLVLFQPETKLESQNLKKINSYDKIYYMRSGESQFDCEDFANVFFNIYDNKRYCIKEISKDKAVYIINKTSQLREDSFHKEELVGLYWLKSVSEQYLQ